jgi:hypothetical protein
MIFIWLHVDGQFVMRKYIPWYVLIPFTIIILVVGLKNDHLFEKYIKTQYPVILREDSKNPLAEHGFRGQYLLVVNLHPEDKTYTRYLWINRLVLVVFIIAFLFSYLNFVH